jgi:hypothetical protein
MRLMKRRRSGRVSASHEDPLAGVANLFDASVALIVSMLLALFAVYNMLEFMDPKSEVTITKKARDGQVEMITKKGTEIKVTKVTEKELSGKGLRLGVAYQLETGGVVYVPD